MPALPRTAWAEIDLDGMAGNLAVLRRLAGAAVPVHPVVKADAYGHGMIPVARALDAAGADGFCVATIDEALVLRDADIDRPILVLYPIPPGLAVRAAEARVAVTAGDAELLREMLAVLAGHPPPAPLAVQLEVETGLGRGGFTGAALTRAAADVAAAPGASLAGAWTHFQDPADATSTTRQLAAFDAAVRALADEGIDLGPRTAAASGGLLADGVVSLDGVRPGLATYGLVPDGLVPATAAAAATAALRPILSLHARPVRVTDLPAGSGISYGPSYTTTRTSRIATLPLGYGDGWPRSLSNRASVLVRGRRVPLVGTVAMDAVMADVTDVPGAPVGVHDEFVLLGEQGNERITVAELAAARATISWEVVTSLAGRLPRVYHAAAVPRETRTLID